MLTPEQMLARKRGQELPDDRVGKRPTVARKLEKLRGEYPDALRFFTWAYEHANELMSPQELEQFPGLFKEEEMAKILDKDGWMIRLERDPNTKQEILRVYARNISGAEELVGSFCVARFNDLPLAA